MSRISLVTFDVTNTLMKLKNSIGFEYLKIAEIYCNQNLLKDNFNRNQCENHLTNAFKTVWKDMNTKHENFGLKSGMTSLEWWTQTVKNTFRLSQYLENQINDKQLDNISKHLFKHYSSANCWTVDTNSHKVLSELKKSQQNLKIGVISNFDERLEHILHEIGLRHYFDFVLISRLAKYSKPSKEIFDLGLKCAELLDSTKALHIGDDLHLDYLPAKRFGWNALLFKNINKLSEQQLSQINKNDCISHLTQVLDKI